MHLFLEDVKRFDLFDKTKYPLLAKERSQFLKDIGKSEDDYYIVYSDYYLGETMRFAMGLSRPLAESETLICIDETISFQSYSFKNIEDLNRLWLYILEDEEMHKKRAYLIDYELHHANGSGVLYLSMHES